MTRIARRSFLAAVVLLGGFAAMPMARAETAGSRVAIKGYDPVSYFDVKHPEKGSAAFSASFDDTTYWFTSAEHRALFVADPDKYAPQYDGFCAMSVAIGQKVEPNPEHWAINDGKLYLFGEEPPGFPPAIPYFRQHTAEVVQAGGEGWNALRKTR